MRRLFLSSVCQGLEAYREAVHQAIQGLDDWKCIRMEDFGARDRQSDELCRTKVEECDLFIGIAGLRYGSCPPGSARSFSEREYDAAMKAAKPILMFLASEEVVAVPGVLRESDEDHEKQKAFRARIARDRQCGIFETSNDIGRDVLKAVYNWSREPNSQNAIAATKITEAVSNMHAQAWRDGKNKVQTVLLFPHVIQSGGFDTGMVVSNISALPSANGGTPGQCVVHYYGRVEPDGPAPQPKPTGMVAGGEQLIWTLFAGGVSDSSIKPTPGFTGYVVVECGFRARGFAFISDLGAQKVATGYLAEVLEGGQRS